jgi:ribosomal protein L13E
MPAVSRNQAVAARIAEHAPDKVYARNAGLAKMPLSSLRHFARTPTQGLPKKVKRGR